MFFLDLSCKHPCLHCMSQSTSTSLRCLLILDGFWTCCVDSLLYHGPTPVCSCLQVHSCESRCVCFCVWELSLSFYIFYRYGVCLCGFNFQLVQLVGRFSILFVSHIALAFDCGFIPTPACGSSTGVYS